MIMSLKYEGFIRKAFHCGRWGDPARLANQELVDFADQLHYIKAATAYATCILKKNYPEDLMTEVKDAAFDDVIKNILSAKSLKEIYDQIDIINAFEDEII